MLDLETFGTTPGSVLRSIGAIAFDPVTGELGRAFLVNVDRASCEEVGLHVDPKTELWWSEQSIEAQAALERDPLPLRDALVAFELWFEAVEGSRLWCHGPNFDEPLLAAAYRACYLTVPWQFASARCTRTIYDLAGVKPDRAAGVHHNALDDARAQALAVIEAYRILGLAETSRPVSRAASPTTQRWLPRVAAGEWAGSAIDAGADFDGRYIAIQWGRLQAEISVGRRPA